MDRFNQIDYHIQAGRIQAMADRFRPDAIVAETNSIGIPMIEQLQRLGLPIVPFTTTNASKQIAIDSLALAFERGQLRIIPDPVLMAELEAFTMEKLPSGMLRYSAPSGGHDDTVMSLAFAWHGMTGRSAATAPAQVSSRAKVQEMFG
jgi:phage terminase large subunit-like protein